jgi:hypothetical protein
MNGGEWLSIRHRDFYDVPRLVVVEYQGVVYVFDSPFDDELDDYPDHYTVYRLPRSELRRLDAASWEGLAAAGEELGRIPVADVEFDATRRERLNAAVFGRLGIS